MNVGGHWLPHGHPVATSQFSLPLSEAMPPVHPPASLWWPSWWPSCAHYAFCLDTPSLSILSWPLAAPAQSPHFGPAFMASQPCPHPPFLSFLPPCSSYSALGNQALFLLERRRGALGPAWPSVLPPLSQQACSGRVPDSTGSRPCCWADSGLGTGMRDGFMASLQEGRHSQRSAPSLSLLLLLLPGVTAAVTAAICLGGGGSDWLIRFTHPPLRETP